MQPRGSGSIGDIFQVNLVVLCDAIEAIHERR
jgi:hypothetical protein